MESLHQYRCTMARRGVRTDMLDGDDENNGDYNSEDEDVEDVERAKVSTTLTTSPIFSSC